MRDGFRLNFAHRIPSRVPPKTDRFDFNRANLIPCPFAEFPHAPFTTTIFASRNRAMRATESLCRGSRIPLKRSRRGVPTQRPPEIASWAAGNCSGRHITSAIERARALARKRGAVPDADGVRREILDAALVAARQGQQALKMEPPDEKGTTSTANCEKTRFETRPPLPFLSRSWAGPTVFFR